MIDDYAMTMALIEQMVSFRRISQFEKVEGDTDRAAAAVSSIKTYEAFLARP